MFPENSRVDEPEHSLQLEQAKLENFELILDDTDWINSEILELLVILFILKLYVRITIFTRKLNKTCHNYLDILLPCLGNHSEEAMFGSNQIQEQHKTSKGRSYAQKHLIKP